MSPRALARNDQSIGFITSFLLHAVLMLVGGFLFAKPIQYAVQAGNGGVEVSLTAAPAELTSTQAPAPLQETKPAQEIKKDPEDMPLPAPAEELKPAVPEAKIKEEPKKVQTAVNSKFKGDGSSAMIGKDSTTFYSAGGAVSEAKPNYLKNPAPAYPWEARKNGWEGAVILKVFVDKTGRAVQIEKEQTSGYAILDDSAIKAVKGWRFAPAQLGGFPVNSIVRIPVRFELKK